MMQRRLIVNCVITFFVVLLLCFICVRNERQNPKQCPACALATVLIMVNTLIFICFIYLWYFSTSMRLLSSKVPQTDDDLDKPIRFSTSKAVDWKAEYSFSGQTDEDVTPSYQPLVVCVSVGLFLIYFAVLREENDVDEELSVSLYDRIDGLEEVQLKNAIQYYKDNDPNYDIVPMQKRLAELQALKKK